MRNYLISILVGCTLLFIACQEDTSSNLFETLSPAQTGITFTNTLQENDTFNIIQYLYFYNGGGVAIGDINRDSLPDIFFTANQQPNKLYLNKGDFQFEDISTMANIGGIGNWSTGVNMVDINADGWLDIYVCQVGGYKDFKGSNQLYINQQDGTFKEEAAEYGLAHEGFSSQSAFLDYDLDGDLDMYLLCHSVHSTATYQDTSKARQRDQRAGDKLYRNDNGRFVEVTEQAGIYSGIAGYGLAVGVSDLNLDGCPDIYISNDFHENDFCYINNCDGTFSEQITKLFGHTSQFSMGSDLADINNDGLLDIMTVDMKPEEEVIYKSSAGIDPYDIYQFKLSYGYHYQFPRNSLQLNRGNGFSDVAYLADLAATDWSWSPLVADFDNDGWKDMHITNGIVRRPNDLDYLKFIANKKIQEQASDLELAAQMPDGKVANYFFKNNGDWTFSKVSENWGITQPSFSNGAAYADLDRDGDLDLVVNNIDEPAFVFKNQSNQLSSGNYLTIHLKGRDSNPFAIGAKVTLFTNTGNQYQELNPVRGWQSSVDYPLHFGLGAVEKVDSVKIIWPSGQFINVEDVAINQTLYIKENDTYSRPMASPSDGNTSSDGEAIGRGTPLFDTPKILDFQHQENRFSDVDRERLIPYLLSTQGPTVAVADINGDELQDFFIGGASQQSGSLFIQDATGSFTNIPFPKEGQQEEVASLFFDADQDGDQDLYVGSGGNEFYRQDKRLVDRLYLNDGKGNFEKSSTDLPLFYNQTSCVRAIDMDKDGDIDLFIGSRSIPVRYGMPPDSYVLLNDGAGNFKIGQTFKELGMVTDAVWTDIDADNDPDLVVVGEWMSPTIFKNNNGSLTRNSQPATRNSSGWWQSIAAADFDQDGDEDWIIGNWGLNTNLRPTEEEPLYLYLKDFDKNLSIDPILSYFRQGQEYPFAHLDDLGKQLVFLKRQYRQYDQFSNATFQEVFPSAQLKGAARLKVQTLASVYVENVGHGQFKARPLAIPAQLSSVHSILIKDFDKDEQLDVLMGGNFHEVQPAIGKLDASYGTFLKGDGMGNFEVIDNKECGLWLEGQIRDMKLIQIGKEPYVLVGRNNQSVQWLRLL